MSDDQQLFLFIITVFLCKKSISIIHFTMIFFNELSNTIFNLVSILIADIY